MMDVLGFDIASITHSRHTLVDEQNPRVFEFFSVVGRRGGAGGDRPWLPHPVPSPRRGEGEEA
jgi:hypothetical protein